MEEKPQEYVSLSELTDAIQNVLRHAIPLPVWVVAEVAAINHHYSGHCYMELVEYEGESRREKAKMRATVWKNVFAQVQGNFIATTGRDIEVGMRILMYAIPEFHKQYGMSLNIRKIDPSFTIGELEVERQRTIAQLVADGIIDMNKLHQLPELPKRIAVISASGAAGYGDFCKHIEEAEGRYHLHIALFEASMQGAEAAASIIKAFETIAAQELLWDVVVLIRGGGSRLDLGCFDSYELASNVAQFPLPVIAGIGHERDKSVVDLVAHTSLKTPTAVADYLAGLFAEAENQLEFAMQGIERAALGRIAEQEAKLAHFPQLLRMGLLGVIFRLEQEQNSIEKTLELVNPQRILRRGYTMVTDGHRRIASSQAVSAGDSLELVWHDGSVGVVVEECKDI